MTIAIALDKLHDARDKLESLPKDSTIEEVILKIGEAISEIQEVWGKEDE